MNKSKIEWCDYTWNPVTGCLNGCEYCYARRIAQRFGLDFPPEMGDPSFHGCKYDSPEGLDTMLELNKPYRKNGKIRPFPMAFYPTFYRYKLDEPKYLKKSSKIFVCSMGDLLGDWVPDKWTEAVLKTIRECPQHEFLILTKNPKRYKEFNIPENCWCGTTIASNQDHAKAWELLKLFDYIKTFISIEPLLGPVDLDEYELLCKTWRKGATIGKYLDWVIVGAQTGPGAVPPKKKWVQDIIDQCRAAGVLIFLKNNLHWPEKIQEWPEVLR